MPQGVQAVPLMVEQFQRAVSQGHAITCLNWSMSATQRPMLAVGTNDGLIHLFSVGEAHQPQAVWSVKCQPHIRPLQIGFPTPGREEVVVIGRDRGDVQVYDPYPAKAR